MKVLPLCVLCFFGITLPLATCAEGDARAGFVESQRCQGCHNITGYNFVFPNRYSVPYLGGQAGKYIESALKSYATHQRPAKTMVAIASALNPKEIENLAAYYSQMPAIRVQSAPYGIDEKRLAAGQELYKTKACATCHGTNGVSTNPDYPTLSHQHADYLAIALKQYRGKIRKNPIMQGFVAGLTDDEIKNIALFLESQSGGVFNPHPSKN